MLVPALAAIVVAGLSFAGAARALELNEASQAELESLRGIGVAMSERLLEARRERPFRDWADLLARVKGLRPAGAARLSAEGLTVAGQRFGDEAAAPEPARPR